MQSPRLTVGVRERGYELLFLASAVASIALRPTLRQAQEVEDGIHRWGRYRAGLEQIRRHGLVEAAEARAGRVLRLTDAGRRVFHGGRDPEAAWNRGWDGQWRMIVFDLPRPANQARLKFWRWLRAQHFGRLQGSVWVTPDPAPELGAAVAEAGLEPSMVVVFAGALEGGHRSPRDLSMEVWDFPSIGQLYQRYSEFARGMLRHCKDRQPTAPEALRILHEDRRRWWHAVRSDPLLPRELLPADYSGLPAWKLRQELHSTLAPALATNLHT
jgi:phenylacetic acid degradation operon negative regulatory protein